MKTLKKGIEGNFFEEVFSTRNALCYCVFSTWDINIV